MITLLIAVGSFVGFIVAYHTYGKWLSKKIFVLDPEAEVPSKQLRDDIDFIPTKKGVIFGHHFTSIAGPTCKTAGQVTGIPAKQGRDPDSQTATPGRRHGLRWQCR